MTTELLLPAAGVDTSSGYDFYQWGESINATVGNGLSQVHVSPQLLDNDQNWNKLALAEQSTIAIKSNGTLWTWGTNDDGQLGLNNDTARSLPTQVGALSNWAQVSFGNDGSNGATALAVKTDGTLWAWGTNANGQVGNSTIIDRSSPVQIGALSNWAQVEGGERASFAITTTGALYAWGINLNGQLGTSSTTTIQRSSPVQVGALSDWAQISAGDGFCVSVKTDNTIWSWGHNGSGQLGLNISAAIDRSSPVQIGALSDWAQASAGAAHSLAVKTDGTLWSWGGNSQGQLGDGTKISKSSPIQIGALSDWAQVAAGSDFSLAVKTDDTLWAWGGNNLGGLASGNLLSKSSPVQVGSLSNWTEAYADYTVSLSIAAAKNTSNNIYFWGDNQYLNFGIGKPNALSPVFIGANYLNASNGNTVTAAIKSDGSLWTWGQNEFGQLGSNEPNTIKSLPSQAGTSTDWQSIAAGDSYCIAIKNDSTLWAWGNNDEGQLGLSISTTVTRSSPVQVGALSDWVQVSAGSTHYLSVKTNNTLWAGGEGNNGRMGLNSVTTRSSPVAVGSLSNWAQASAGAAHSLAVKTNGTLWAWGIAASGRLGQNSIVSRSSPVQIGNLSDWAQVSAGFDHSLAVKTNGTLWAWGFNGQGRLGDGTEAARSSPVQIGALSDWAQVSAKDCYSLAIKTDGTIWSWGQNTDGGLGDGTTNGKSSPIQVGSLTGWDLVNYGESKTSGALLT